MEINGKVVTGNPDLIRKMNRSLIIKTIMEKESISRSELEVQTSLALPTIMRIVSALIEEGLVEEVGKGDSSGGRRPVMLKMKSDSMYFIGVGLQRVLYVILADVSGNIIARYNKEMKYHGSIDLIIKQILEGINNVLAQSKIDISRLMFAGLGIPGTEVKQGYDKGINPYDTWVDTDPENWKETREFPCPIVFDNNATLGALGELSFGAARNCRNSIYLHADHGVGSGVVIDGNLYKGSHNVAGEFGHTIIDIDGQPCYCGNKGCLEMYCSTNAIINMLIKDKHADLALVKKLTKNPDFSLVRKAAYHGDKIALKYIEESARVLGMGIASLVNMFNPDKIIVGGELPESCPGYIDIVAESVKKGVFRNRAAEVEILTSELKSDAVVRGAVALAMAQVFDHI